MVIKFYAGEFLLIIAFLILVKNVGNAQSFFVTLEGNDSAIGTKENPFATIERALEEIASLRTNGQIHAATINLRKGIYLIHHSIKLGSEFSDINIQAYQKEKVIFFGGVTVTVNKIESISDFEINSIRPAI